MSAPLSCPDAARLRQLLDGRLSEQEQAELGAHLEGCAACRDTLKQMGGDEEAWFDRARRLAEARSEPEEALHRVMAALKRVENVPDARHEEPGGEDHGLGLLGPGNGTAQIGRLGPYEVLEVVAGGPGIVLRARDPHSHREVAIKLLAPGLAASLPASTRFLRAAQAYAAIRHPHVIALHAVQHAPGPPFLVMEYVPGPTLQQLLEQRGALEVPEVLRIGMQTALGLAAVHDAGLVHRDLKPSSILLEQDGQRAKITAFGLGRTVTDTAPKQGVATAGSPLYLAPEQARGEPVGHHADLFALGSVLYAMATGRPPFLADNPLAVLKRIREDQPRPIHETNPLVPDWLVALIARLHAKDPAQRYQSAKEVAEQLGGHLGESQQPAQPGAPARAAPQQKGLPRTTGCLGLFLALVLALGGLLVLHTGLNHLFHGLPGVAR
jgi:eukaryotic-like serine/threonine-protein kinase